MAKKFNLKLTSPFAGLKILVAWPLPAIFVPFTKLKGPFNRFDTFVGIISQIDKNLKFIFTQKSLSRSLLFKLSSYFAWRIDGQYWPWVIETNTKIHARNHSLPGFVIFHNLLKNWKFFTFRHNFLLRFYWRKTWVKVKNRRTYEYETEKISLPVAGAKCDQKCQQSV